MNSSGLQVLALINAVDSGAIQFRHVAHDGVADRAGLAWPRPQQAHAEAVEGWLAPDHFATHHLDVVLACLGAELQLEPCNRPDLDPLPALDETASRAQIDDSSRTTPGSAPAGHRTRSSSAPHLLLERNVCRDTALKPDVVVQLSVDQHRAALDDAHRNAAATFSLEAVDLHDLEDERFPSCRRLPADGHPLALSVLVNDHVGKDSERAVDWCCHVESLVASSIRHHLQVGKGHAARVLQSAMGP